MHHPSHLLLQKLNQIWVREQVHDLLTRLPGKFIKQNQLKTIQVKESADPVVSGGWRLRRMYAHTHATCCTMVFPRPCVWKGWLC